jgi:hypothetical protein
MKTPNVADEPPSKERDIPSEQAVLYRRLDEMVAEGLATSGPKWGEPLPEDFFTRQRPRAKKSVVEALLEDRDEGP